MKRLPILYAFALSLLLFQTSCNKDDEAPAPNPLIGEWELYKVNLDFPGTTDDGEYPASYFVDFYKVTFNADNSFIEEIAANSPINSSEGEWTLTNKEVTLDFDSGTDETYTLNTENTLLTGESFNAQFEDDEGNPVTAAITFILRKDQ